MKNAQERIINHNTTQDQSSIFWALAARLSPFVVGLILTTVGLSALGSVAPVVVLLLRGQDTFVRHHVISELANQAFWWTLVALATAFSMMTCGLGSFIAVPALIILFVLELPFWLYSLNEAYHGRTYQYPWLTPFLSQS